ncbi:MAG: UDP-N-acetylglucosamine--N-acetylmuramyl-(pentapeptide) pyrophosphoryl-undecaprenol N-acetylglucosamine transferase [Kiritimatiellae bacterium]|nr:UDP-N-acetylglucosamine--N-acetylmuramyl-(pentapeptide) pyrophosphoryl-undecaprenol N-acetylglucosamine transferase [Kiritimatiellia bacterium]
MGNQTKKRFVVACGGTGGHVFPGLAVANVLRARGHEVTVWLSGRDIEQSTLNAWNGPIFSTGARQLSLKTLFSLIRSLWICKREMRRYKPDAILAMGSYSSLPPVLAAWSAKVPIMLHEANAVPGKAIDFLSRFATRVAISFEVTAKWLRRTPTVYTGLPIRSGLIGQPPFSDIPKEAFTFLVTGGSQGAHRVNELAAQAFTLLQKEPQVKPFYVIHQCGKADEAWLKETYEKNGVQARVAAFIPEMGRAFASADFVVCRAGASTCFELCALGKAALLIPLPSAIRNHQHLNAEALVMANAADEAAQSELTGRSLERYLRNKMNNPTQIRQMELAMKTCAVPDADVRVAQALESL